MTIMSVTSALRAQWSRCRTQEEQALKAHTIRQQLLATTIIGGLVAFAAPVMAQTQPAATQVDEVVVTGSRIPQANLVTTSPVSQVTAEDVDVAGVTRIEDLVNQMPQAFAAQNSTVSNGASGTATVSLRNLGSDRTLVLIDGRRMGYGSPADSAADLNQIPGQLVERVEVLTGGASAVYGSDAVAGVVNFIMQKNFEGISLDVQVGTFQHNNDYDGPGNMRAVIAARGATNPTQFQLPDDNVTDGLSRDVNLVMGINSPDGRGNVTAYAGYRHNEAVLQGERDYSSCAIGSATAAGGTEFTCGGSSTAYPGRFTDFATFDYSIDQTTGNFIPWSGDYQYNYGPLNYFQRPDERYTYGAFGHYQINDKAEAYAQVMAADYSTVAQIAPSGDFFSTSTINCGNPLLSAQQSAAIGCSAGDIAADTVTDMYIGRRNVEGGGRQDDLNLNSFRTVIGVRGEINPAWTYDVAGQYSKVRLSRIYRNEFSTVRLNRALDVVDVAGTPTCRSVVNGSDPTCVPYDIFSIGGVTPAALAYVQIPLLDSGTVTQQVVTASFTGDLGTYGFQSPMADNGVRVAFGAEYRRDSVNRTPDVSFQTGDGAGQGGPTNPLSGSVSVKELFMEADVPLVNNAPGVYDLGLDLAYRYSDYDTGIQTDTYKIGLGYSPIESLKLRGSFSRAVRAPNVIELFSVQGFNLFDMDFDPCGATPTATLAQCLATGVTAAQYGTGALDSPAGQYNYLGGGNPNLEPEEADTFTIGFVARPDFLPRFDISVDYFDIAITNLISSIGAQNSVNACYDQNLAAACARLNRNANGQLWVGTGYVEDIGANVGGLSTAGVDVNANYRIDLADMGVGTGNYGSLAFNFTGTYLEELVVDPGAEGGTPYDCKGSYGNECGTPNPEWRHRFRVAWDAPMDISVSGTWRYFSSVDLFERTPTTTARVDRHFDAENYFDLAATWQVLDNTRIRLGVNNIFDNDPPLSASVGTTGNGNTYPQTYDSMGRYFFFGVTADF